MRSPRVLVFDSGIGGLTVFREIRAALESADFVYMADDAAFPYGRLGEADVIARVVEVMETLIPRHEPDLVVIACNTASTLVLPALRARFAAIPFVGTVPAIKPAAALTRTGHLAVLGTPGTVRRDYTKALIEKYAGGIAVTLVGAAGLAGLAEAELRGEKVDADNVLAEIRPCFVEDGSRAVDVVVLACTHYPLLLDTFRRVAPWQVTWLDPAPAIARRVVELIAPRLHEGKVGAGLALFSDGRAATTALREALARAGLSEVRIEPLPLKRH